ncbi:mediator complex protein-domain-containing protein [Pyronema domesticum]|uniref:Mediator of RNA polymerase II transcription subunit 11 n=1 Tax=Pyronema omphalodes (strain CBS 100304) TaxID=1076935 RepID=U4LMN3_PYROM|nr:mediator complex protein-domain-containing protein [Pyronema domesticum]CCX15413.1 Similar to hypothetical protein [Tuber melanosporum Mel28]; acc. no. XP_002839773 [Pyronema omphalodes CBS 100304]
MDIVLSPPNLSPDPTHPHSAASKALESLSSIDTDISLLLSSASSAIRCLTNSADPAVGAEGTPNPTNPSPAAPTGTPEERFTHHTEAYHKLLSSITVRLRRQILALQAAEIPVGIDVGTWNARNDVVGREMERELWEEAKGVVEAWAKGEEGWGGQGGVEGAMGEGQGAQGGEEMVIDG